MDMPSAAKEKSRPTFDLNITLAKHLSCMLMRENLTKRYTYFELIIKQKKKNFFDLVTIFDFVEVFVLTQRDCHVGGNPGNFKNGAVFDVLPRCWLYKTCFHCGLMPEKYV